MSTPVFHCAVPRYEPRRCTHPATLIVKRERGEPIGGGEQAGPPHIEEPACAGCAEPHRKMGATVRLLAAADYKRVCQDDWCESGALAVPGGDRCPDCLDRAAEDDGDGERFANL